MRVANFIIIFVLTHAFIIGCAGHHKSTDIFVDENANATAVLAPEVSVISIPAEINVAYIENIIGNQLGGVIFQGDMPLAGDIASANVTVTKSGNAGLQARGNELYCNIPVKITMRFQTLGLSHTAAEAEISLKLRSRISLNNNWTVSSQTTPIGHEWISDPVVKIGFMTIPVKPAADRLVSRYIGDVCKAVDMAISKDRSIKNLLTSLWNEIQNPVEVSVPSLGERLWLRFDPSEIYASQPVGRGTIISTSVGIRAVAEAFAGEKPETRTPKPLPDFKTPEDGTDSSFAINLYPEITFEQATAISREAFVGRTFRSGLQRVRVHDIVVGGGDSGMVTVRMETSGSIKGTISVKGRAVYNGRERVLSINDFVIEIDTPSGYQKVRNRLAKGLIESKMKAHMKFPLGDKMDDAKTLLQNMLTTHKLPQGFVLNGSVGTFEVRGVEVTETGFRAAVTAHGAARVGSNNLSH